MNRNKRKALEVIGLLAKIMIGIVMIYPVLWMFFSSFKENREIFNEMQKMLPDSFDMKKYITGWMGFGGVTFGSFFRNSMLITVAGTIGAVCSSAFIAFGFARCRFKFRNFWFICMLLTMMLPTQVTMIPKYIIFNKIGWVGTFLPLIVPAFTGEAFFIFLIMQFIRGIPRELDEAAKIDGCSSWNLFAGVILPLSKPALVTAGIFSFMWKWDDFMGPLMYLNKPKMYTASLAIKMFADSSSLSDWGSLFAMAALSLVPIFLIFVTFQKYLVEGIATSGLKG